MLASIAAVAVGAALGALVRWQVGARWNARFPSLPPGTLAVNVVGGYLVGVAVAWFAVRPDLSPAWRLFAITGFLGGLTTFSTFSAEVAARVVERRPAWALATIATHVGGSVAMTILGIVTVGALR